MIHTKPTRKRPAFYSRPFSLTDTALAQLEAVAFACSDLCGRKVSVSAVVRALAGYASQPGREGKLIHKLVSLIEAEQQKVVRGKLPAQTRTSASKQSAT